MLSFTFTNVLATNISGVINTYGAVQSVDVCTNKMAIDDATPFSVGDTVLIIQMKGATMDETNTATFGDLISLNGAGQHEFNIISSITGNDVVFTKTIQNTYDVLGKVQIIGVPYYPADVTVTGTVSAMPWDGSKGGIVVINALNNVILNDNIDVSGQGFRGGQNIQSPPYNCAFAINIDAQFYPAGTDDGSGKGEGVVNFIIGKETGRGKQLNGGGGGNDHNSGGGGGAGFALGGKGGDNNEPGAFNCDGYFPGVGGAFINNSIKLIMSGGGGAGHGNNGNYSGGNAGGIILIYGNSMTPNGNSIISNGLIGNNNIPIDNDGGSGGGAGGRIYLNINSATANINVTVNGGRGDNVDAGGNNRCQGPGGGGGAGLVVAPAVITLNASLIGGNSGIITNSTNVCNLSSSNAVNGSAGAVQNSPALAINFGPNFSALSVTPTVNPIDTVLTCVNQNVTVVTNPSNTLVNAQWQIKNAGIWQNLTNVAPYSTVTDTILNITNVLSAMNSNFYRAFIYSTCDTIFSDSIVLIVETFAVTQFDTSCVGITLPDGLIVNTSGTYTSTVSTLGACDTIFTTHFTKLNQIAITTQPITQSICTDSSVMFFIVATGTDITYQWKKEIGGGIFADIPGATNDTLIIPNVTTPLNLNGEQFRVVMNSACNNVVGSSMASIFISNSVLLTSFTGSTTECENTNTIFSATTNGNETSSQWQVDAGTGFVNLSNNANYIGVTTLSLSVSLIPLSFDANKYRLIVFDNCGVSDTTADGVLTVTPLPSFTTQPNPLNVCVGSNVLFSTVATNAISYQWQVNTGSGFTDIVGEITNSLSLTSVTETVSGNTYQCIATNACGTTTSSDALLTVNEIGQILSQPNDVVICPESPGFNFELNVEYENIATFQWQIDTGLGYMNIIPSDFLNINGINTNVLQVTVPYEKLDDASLLLTYVDNCGLGGTSNPYKVNIRTKNPINGIPDIEMCMRDLQIVEVDYDGINYSWNDDNATVGRFIEPTSSGEYIVTFRQNSSKCLATDTVNIEIVDCLANCVITAPSGFSPRTIDGANDGFKVITTCALDYFDLAVIDRWGTLIFQTNDIKIAWDGTYKGTKVPIGNYAWNLKYNIEGLNKQESVNGNITIIR